MTDAFTEWESKIGIDPLDVLHAQRDKLVQKVAPLEALYGTWGTYDNQRKVNLAAVKALIRAEQIQKGSPLPQGIIDDMAHGHGKYVDFVTNATLERAEYTILKNEIKNIEDRIIRGNGLIGFARSEARL